MKHMLTDQKSRKECNTKCGVVTTVENVVVWRTDVDCPDCLAVMWHSKPVKP